MSHWFSTLKGVEAYIINLNNITGNNLISIDFDHLSIAPDIGFESQCLLEALDNVAGMILLSESNTSVEDQQPSDDAEVDPVLQASG